MIKFLLSILRLIRYKQTPYDKGRHLENLTYKSLRHFEKKGGKFLANLLIPKKQGGTTEIDLLLICSKGLFVFECKNYDGWIFGNEAQKKWTQILPKGQGLCHKENFYNPIMQNASHIKHLKNLIGNNLSMWSIIVFSDKCEFKNVTIKNNHIRVIKHCKISSVVYKMCNQIKEIYTEAEINNIYSKLCPYTQN